MHIQYNDLYSHDLAKDPDNNEIINLGRPFLFFIFEYVQANKQLHPQTHTQKHTCALLLTIKPVFIQ